MSTTEGGVLSLMKLDDLIADTIRKKHLFFTVTLEISIQLDYFWCLTSYFHDTEHNNMFLIHNYNHEYANSEKHLLLNMTVILEISMQFFSV